MSSAMTKFMMMITILVLAAMPVAVNAAAASDSPTTPYVPVPGASMECIAKQAGVSLNDVAVMNGVVNPAMLTQLDQVLLPAKEQTLTSVRLLQGETRLTTAIRHGVSWWGMLSDNPVPAFTDSFVSVPGAPSACLPYPVLATAFDQSRQLKVKQGQVAMLGFDVTKGSLCEVAYLDTTTPCFPGQGGWQYAFVAINALDDPGVYPLDVAFTSEGVTSHLHYDLVVELAYYGFQYIDPPPELNQLMDAEFMQEELDFLAKWRTIRTGERQWALPLAYPLAVQTSISADYGAERSYGGMVDGYHSGVDYRASRGTTIVAPADGTVLMSQFLGARGNAILIDHGWGLVTGYWHCHERLVSVGQQVQRGDAIATVGNTGLSTGPHLHWEVWMNGVSVDGKQWLTGDLYGACAIEGCRFEPSPVAMLGDE